MNPPKNNLLPVSELLQNGLVHHHAGRLQEAEAIYQSILQEQPQHPGALHLLGVIAHQTGKHETAVNLIEQAIKINPNVPDFYNNCGEAYRALHRNDLAITHYEQALAIKPDYAEAHNNLGNTFQDLDRAEDAIAYYEQALAIKPDYADAYNNLGVVLQELGRQEDAITRYEQALAIKPDNAKAHNNLGAVLQELGRQEDAITCYEQALAINPDFVEAYNNLGFVLQELGRHEEAIPRYEQALAINPDFAQAHNNLGVVLQELGRQEDAIAHHERALAIKPHYAEAYNNLAYVLQDLGRQKEAITRIEQALAIKPDFAEAHRNLTSIKPSEEQIPIIKKLLKSPVVSDKNAVHYHYALGNIFDDAKSHDKAFEHYLKANTLKRNTISYDAKKHSVFVESLIKVYSKSYFQEKVVVGSDSELPVFIVGMPRSGTTLVEQIVSSHSQVYGAGELSLIWRIEKTIAKQFEASRPYPECMSLCKEAIAEHFSTPYLKEIGKYSQNAIHITDKMPDNFLRIGLIKILFPKARIIHCQRSALDTCTSIFLKYFVSANEYSFDLTELGQYYLDYERLMAHWRSLFPSEIFEVQYEEIVMHQEKITRQLVDYLGLDWDEKCLDFHSNKRTVRTASNLQVRKPIYKNSINRWKQYEEHLGSLIGILQHLS